MSNHDDGQGQQPENEQQPSDQQPGQSGGHRLPGQSGAQPRQDATGGQQPWTGGQQQPGNTGGQQPWTGGQPPQQGNTGGQQPWAGGQPPQQGNTGGQQPWTGGQQPWSSGGQPAQPPSWSTGETGPNVGPTMNNPQSSYYDRFSQASGEGVVVPPKGSGTGGGRGKILIGIAAALVLVIAAVAIYAFTRNSDKTPTPAASSPVTSSLPPVTATTWVNPTLAAGQRALKSGWQAQSASDPRGVFDVPENKDWTLESKDTLFGYADSSGKPLVVAKAPARYGVGFCSAKKTAESAWLGLVNVGKRDPADAGPDLAQRFADAISLKKDGSHAKQGKMSAAKQVKVNQDTIPALEYTITTAVGDPDGCDKGHDYEIRTVTFQAGGKSYQLVAIRELDAPGGKTLSTKVLDEIITTFRPSS
ncbi:hypothetical protein [Flexivirga oryzae]|uniref:DUF8017 domain-containing protein n=1 Tax=Flexivirga oryzae TaxID=1794944 RepID=A0A839N5D0_9MICO|nr:hypothetical protein [Flexivirga oryzae]MBB2892950.1 hypothetical protein [Flexivirga oryzae]